MNFNISNVFKLFISIAVCQAAGFIGTLFTNSTVSTWYDRLEKPFFNPPAWVFGPAWIILYTLMGIALFLVWKQGLNKPNVKTAIFVFGIQLLLNAVWTPVFFGLKSISGGLVIITLLWFAILTTIFRFFKVSRNAAFLLIPYILWVSYAFTLNLSILILN